MNILKNRHIHRIFGAVLCFALIFQTAVPDIFAMSPDSDIFAMSSEPEASGDILENTETVENAETVKITENAEIIGTIETAEVTEAGEITEAAKVTETEEITEAEDISDIFADVSGNACEDITSHEGSYVSYGGGAIESIIYETTDGKGKTNGYFLPSDVIRLDFSDYKPLLNLYFVLTVTDVRNSAIITPERLVCSSISQRYIIPETTRICEETAQKLSIYNYLFVVSKSGSQYTYFETIPFDCKTDGDAPEVSVSEGVKSEDADNPRAFYRYRLLNAEIEEDKSGLPEEYISFSYDESEDNWGNSENFIAEKNGAVYVKARDMLGNVSTTSVLIDGIDTAAPDINDIKVNPVNPVGGYALNAEITVDASDGGSGIDEQGYGIAYGQDASECVYVSSNTIVAPQNGVYTVAVRDKAGNISAARITVDCIDRVSPSITITGNPSSKVNDDVDLAYNVSDADSGLDSIYVQDDEVGYKTLLASCSGKVSASGSVRITQNGSYTFTVKDRLGNTAKKTVQVTKIDRTVSKKSSSSSSSKKSSSSSSDIKLSVNKKAIVSDGGSYDPTSPASVGGSEVVIKDYTDYTPDAGDESEYDTDILDENGNAVSDGTFRMYEDGTFDGKDGADDLSDEDIIIEGEDKDNSFYGLSREDESGELKYSLSDSDGEKRTISINSLTDGENKNEVSPIRIVIFGILLIILLLTVLAFILLKLGIISVPAVMEKINSFRQSLSKEQDDEEQEE